MKHSRVSRTPGAVAAAVAAVAFAAATLGIPGAVRAQVKLPRPSPKASLEQTVGLTDLKITYSRPGVKGRVIWGELVPYDKVWRTGANEATTLTISTGAKVNGQALPAGTYSIHTIPTTGDWTVIINRKADQWGSYSYDEKEDALRITVKPEPHAHTEWMQFSVVELSPDRAVVALDWEKLRVPITIEVDTIGQALANARAAMDTLKADDVMTAFRCASFAWDNKVALDEAKAWVDRSIAIKSTWLNHRLKANMLAAAGDMKGAVEHATKAVEVGKKDEAPPDELAKIEKMAAEWKAKG
jgi:hypothetical protein